MCVSSGTVHEYLGRITYKVEAINIGLIYPGLKAISNLLWCADKDGAVAADGNVLCNGVLCPLCARRRELGVSVHRRPEAVNALFTSRLSREETNSPHSIALNFS